MIMVDGTVAEEQISDIRNMRFPGQGQGFGMMQGAPQFVQPGIQPFASMQQQRMMSQGQPMMAQGQPMISQGQPMMSHGQPMMPHGQPVMAAGQRMMVPGMYPMMGMRLGPTGAPPAYNRQMQENYSIRKKEVTTGARASRKTEEQLRKERQYQQQRDKLKQFGKATSGDLDPNKLVDSIFGTSDKPKPKPEKLTIPADPDADNSFGDFLSSPPASQSEQTTNPITGSSLTANQSSPITVTTAAVNSHNPSVQQAQLPPKQDKKDLETMMFECSDLKAPQKAKLFQKPALKELQHTHNQGQAPVHHDSQNARKWNQSWNQSEDLSDLFLQEAAKDVQTLPKKPVSKRTSPTSKHPPKPPPWLTDENLLPDVYRHVLEASIVDGMISTERLYPILMLSSLPKELMGHIWSLCNKVTPGQLIKSELYQMLALIALAQNNYQITSVDILNRCPHPPVPRFQQQVPPQHAPQVSQPGPQGAPQMPVPQGVPTSVPGGPQVAQTGASFRPHVPVGAMQETHMPQTGPVSVAPGLQGPQAVQPPGIVSIASSSTPATLPVTQLPSAGAPQGMLGVAAMTTEEDDFADFQAAPPVAPQPVTPQQSGSFGDLMSDVKNDRRSPLKDQAKYLYSVPTPDDAAVAATLSPQDLHQSNVENYFGSDDSSEGIGSHNSLDDEYFDGYKSADSKPSDSTSQFSTDQSENEDFKNFESYLDEFQKKKEQKEKDSPYHRAMANSSPKKNVGSPSKAFPKVIPQKLPEPGNKGQTTSHAQVSADDFADFADFQSAPVNGTKQTPEVTVKLGISSEESKLSASKSELIGEVDKYAALRVLDFSSPSASGTDDLIGEPSVFSATDDNWADFQNAASDDGQISNEPTAQHQSEVKSETTDNYIEADSGWANFKTPVTDNEKSKRMKVDDIPVPPSIPLTVTQTGPVKSEIQVSESYSGKSIEPASDDWADFQAGNDDGFSDFQSSSGDTKNSEEEKPPSLVNVKKGGLVKDDILGLFKVKDAPVTVVKSRDDDLNMYEPPDKVFKDSVEKKDKKINKPLSPQRKAFSAPRLGSDVDDFMGPPPVDHFLDEEHVDHHFGTYSRGYDLDDMMMPTKKDEKEQKHIYGMYGLNPKLVLSGHKKEEKGSHIVKPVNEDDDNDSVSSKDNDTRPKFALGKDMSEDSQSVTSLDFVMSKRVQNLKESDVESGDAQSVSSIEFGNFENNMNKEILPESKSLDSLDLRKGESNDDGSQESSDKEKDSLDKEPVDDVVLADLESIPTPELGLPVIGDRYSNILHDIPGSDKHAYEWQRCLDNCCRMIKDANNIFNSVSSSAVCNEIIRSTQGSEYIQGIIEIYRVVCKVTVSMKTAAIYTKKLKQLLKDIDLAWNNLTAFLVGGSVMPDGKSLDFSHGVLMSDDTTAQYLACGVCLLTVDMKMKGGGQENGNSVAKLTYGGRQYHAACANFWINCVDSTLPALKLPELL